MRTLLKVYPDRAPSSPADEIAEYAIEVPKVPIEMMAGSVSSEMVYFRSSCITGSSGESNEMEV